MQDSMILRMLAAIVCFDSFLLVAYVLVGEARAYRQELQRRRFETALKEQLAAFRICVLRDYIEREEPPPSKTVGFQVPR